MFLVRGRSPYSTLGGFQKAESDQILSWWDLVEFQQITVGRSSAWTAGCFFKLKFELLGWAMKVLPAHLHQMLVLLQTTALAPHP